MSNSSSYWLPLPGEGGPAGISVTFDLDRAKRLLADGLAKLIEDSKRTYKHQLSEATIKRKGGNATPLDRTGSLLNSLKIVTTSDGVDLIVNEYYVYNWAKFNLIPKAKVLALLERVARTILEEGTQ